MSCRTPKLSGNRHDLYAQVITHGVKRDGELTFNLIIKRA